MTEIRDAAQASTLDLLRTRRSVPPMLLDGPGPTADELDGWLAIAARVTDHGKLSPWRFLVIEGEARERVGAIIEQTFLADFPQADEKRRAQERQRLTHAPTVVGVVSRAGPHVKIPEWEQVLSVGAVCMNLEHAATALGYAASWITDWYSYDPEALALFGVGAGERVAGFIHIGTLAEPSLERPRPDVAALTTWRD